LSAGRFHGKLNLCFVLILWRDFGGDLNGKRIKEKALNAITVVADNTMNTIAIISLLQP
jgi:hypothetical protein